MDTSLLAHDLVLSLVPALPYLAKVGEEIISKATGDTYDAAKKLLSRLWKKADTAPALSLALEDIAADPGNADHQEILKLQLKKLFTADPAFAAELQALLPTASIQQNTVTNTGAGGVAIGGHNSGSIHIGDRK